MRYPILHAVILLVLGFLLGAYYRPEPSVTECLSVCVDHFSEYNTTVECD